jgi:uncharacterized membrane protein YbhN (UPF0104 family)
MFLFREMLNSRVRDWLIGTALLLALLLWVQWQVGWGSLLAPWRTLPMSELAWLFSLSLLSYLFRGFRLHAYFPTLLSGRLAGTVRLSVLHNFANNLLPMRLGEAVMPLLMRRYFGHDVADSGLSLLWIRLLDLHVLVLVMLVTGWLAAPHWGWWLAVGVALAALPTGFVLRGWLSARLAGRDSRLCRLLCRLLGALPEHGGRFARVYGWTLATWAAKFLAFSLVLQHFTGVRTWQAVTGVIGAELSSVLPFHGVAGAGSYEAALVAAITPTGVDAATALAGAVNLHLFLLGVTLTLGPLALLLPRPAGSSAGTVGD